MLFYKNCFLVKVSFKNLSYKLGLILYRVFMFLYIGL